MAFRLFVIAAMAMSLASCKESKVNKTGDIGSDKLIFEETRIVKGGYRKVTTYEYKLVKTKTRKVKHGDGGYSTLEEGKCYGE